MRSTRAVGTSLTHSRNGAEKIFRRSPAVWPPQEPLQPGVSLPGDLVDEGKLIYFLTDKATSRGPRRGERVSKQAGKRRRLETGVEPSLSDITEEDLGLQYSTVRGYVTAIQKLYKIQKSRGVNTVSGPQGATLRALTKSILSTTWKIKRAGYVDRVEGTLKDVYSPSKIPEHTSAGW